MNYLVRKSSRFFATLALAEHNGKVLSKNTLKLLTAAQKIKDETHLLVCGQNSEELMESINQYAGSNVTKVIKAPTQHLYNLGIAEQISQVIKGIVSQGGYKNVIGLSTSLGKDVIPRSAGQHLSQPISDVIEEENTYVRPTYAGNALTKIKTTQELNFLTFRPSNFDEAVVAQGTPKVEEVQLPSEVKTSFVSEDSADSSKPELTTARVVVSGGRGVKSKENFSVIAALADAFGDAAIGASRAAVDAGYCPNDLQVGQTGKVVAPELYIAVGISGAVQHLAGMKDSKVIVAINTSTIILTKNPTNRYFQIANYGLEADLFKALPEMTEKLKLLKGN